MPAIATYPRPPVALRELLADARAEGLPFEAAWAEAIAAIPWSRDTDTRKAWQATFADTIDAWAAAFEGREDSTLGAVAMLADALDDGTLRSRAQNAPAATLAA